MNLSKKIQFSKIPMIIMGVIVLFLTGCFYEPGELPKFPNVSTEPITYIQSSSAIGGGNVIDDAGSEITQKGVCWSTKIDPTVEDSITKDGTGKGPFISYLRHLLPNTTYYVRAYATSTVGYYFYGKNIRFTTNDLSTVSTELIVSDLTGTTATVGGSIKENNSDTIIARGVCWSTRINPTINDSLTKDGSGPGPFVSKLKYLLPNTTYFVRAYATDYMRTVYGDAIGFVTKKLAIVSTLDVLRITNTTAISGGKVIIDGGEIITERGICWNTNSSPTIDDFISKDATGGTGIFSSDLSDLIPDTKYYIRAYATSLAGTAYANEVSFTTAPLVVDADGNSYHSVIIGTQTWMVENLKTTTLNDGTAILLETNPLAWISLTTPGYCWYNNDSNISASSYGVLYNWHTVNTGMLAPTGWRVPTNDDWTTLSAFVDGDGGKLKESSTINWASPNTGATNVTNFFALPGGGRGNNNGIFSGLGNSANWWSTNEIDATNVSLWSVSYNNTVIAPSSSAKLNGFSVRCIKN